MYFCAFCHLHARACACVCRCFVMNLLMYLAAPGHERRTVLRRSFGVETIGTIMRFIGRAFCLVVVLSSLLLLLFVYMQLLLYYYYYYYFKGGRGQELLLLALATIISFPYMVRLTQVA